MATRRGWYALLGCLAAGSFALGGLAGLGGTLLALRRRTPAADGGADWLSDDQLAANRGRLRRLLGSPAGLRRHVRRLSGVSARAGSESSQYHAEYVRRQWLGQGLRPFSRRYSVLLSRLPPGQAPGVFLCDARRPEADGDRRCFGRLRSDAPLAPEDEIKGAAASLLPYTRPLTGEFALVLPSRLRQLHDSSSFNESRGQLAGSVLLTDEAELRRLPLAAVRLTAGCLLRLSRSPRSPEAAAAAYPDGTAGSDSVIAARSPLATRVKGDPTTPLFPSKEFAVRLPRPPRLLLPYHPAVPLTAADYRLLKAFADNGSDWLRVRVHWPVNTTLLPVENVCAEMRGSEEPDRAVLFAGHRDSWHAGALDPHTGVSSLLEVSRALAELRRGGWRPRRTLVLCTWDAEEWNLIGSAEWLDEEFRRADRRLVAYVNTDTDVMGRRSLLVHAFPRSRQLLRRLLAELPARPYHLFLPPDAASDYFVFWRSLGLPIVDLSYSRSNASRLELYDLYHSRYDSYRLYRLTDPGGRAHLAVAQGYAGVVYTMLDAPLLPVNLSAFAEEVGGAMRRLLRTVAAVAGADDARWSRLASAFKEQLLAAESALRDFDRRLSSGAVETSGQLQRRLLNDKVAEVQKVFAYRSTYPLQDVANLLQEPGSLRLVRRIFRRPRAAGDQRLRAEKLLETCILSLASIPKILSDSFAD